MNSVSDLMKNPFLQRDLDERIRVKEAGRPTPSLSITNSQTVHGRTTIRKFNPELYSKHDWLCGCDVSNSLFCFPCLLFGGDKTWSSTGYKDLIHISNAIVKHELNPTHINNVIDLEKLITGDAKPSPNHSQLKRDIQAHNFQVEKNLKALDVLLDCVKFCAKGYIPIFQGKRRFYCDSDDTDEESSSAIKFADSEAFDELVELVAGLNNTLKNYLRMPLFKKDDRESMKLDLVTSAHSVYHQELMIELKKTHYISIIIEDVKSDEHDFSKVVILRYVINNKPVERIWKLLDEDESSDLLAALKKELEIILQNDKSKLISQSYRRLVLNQEIWKKIQSLYPNANLVHFYQHSIEDIIESSVPIREARMFLGDIRAIFDFFKTHAAIIPSTASFDFDYKNKFELIFTKKDEISSTLENLSENNMNLHFKSDILLDILEDENFLFWLESFNTNIVPTLESFMNEYENCFNPLESMQCAGPSSSPTTNYHDFPDLVQVKIEDDIEIFQPNIDIKVEPDTIQDEPETIRVGKRKLGDDRDKFEEELLDLAKNQLGVRMNFRGHAFAKCLVDTKFFERYSTSFPNSFLEETIGHFPSLNQIRLRAELEVIYSRTDFRMLEGPIELLTELSNIKSTFQETVELLNIVLTIPGKTDSDGCCFDTLRNVEYFFRTSKDDFEYAPYLIVLACEREFIEDIFEFNEKVVKIFAEKPGRREHFKKQVMPN